MLMPSLSVVIPVYRSEKSVALVVEALALELPRLAERYEVILVEDDGGDGSWAVIQQLSARYSIVRGYKLTRNFGQHNALLWWHPRPPAASSSRPWTTTCSTRPGISKSCWKNSRRAMMSCMARLTKNSMACCATWLRRRPSWRCIMPWARIQRAASAHFVFSAPNFASPFAQYRGPQVNIDVLLAWSTTRFAAVVTPARPARDWRIHLHLVQAGHPCLQYDHRFQHLAPARRPARSAC